MPHCLKLSAGRQQAGASMEPASSLPSSLRDHCLWYWAPGDSFWICLFLASGKSVNPLLVVPWLSLFIFLLLRQNTRLLRWSEERFIWLTVCRGFSPSHFQGIVAWQGVLQRWKKESEWVESSRANKGWPQLSPSLISYLHYSGRAALTPLILAVLVLALQHESTLVSHTLDGPSVKKPHLWAQEALGELYT